MHNEAKTLLLWCFILLLDYLTKSWCKNSSHEEFSSALVNWCKEKWPSIVYKKLILFAVYVVLLQFDALSKPYVPGWEIPIGKFLFPREVFKDFIKLFLIHWVDWVPWNRTWIVKKIDIYSIFNASYKCVWILPSILLSFCSFCAVWTDTLDSIIVPLVKKVTSCDGLTMSGH